MYLVLLSSLGIGVLIYKKCKQRNRFRSNKLKNSKPFYNKDEYNFYITEVEFYKDSKLVKTREYNTEFSTQKKIEFNENFIFDSFIINYYYNNNFYKFYARDNYVTFPNYTKEQIKNYVYINNITKALLTIEYNPINIKIETNETNETNLQSQQAPSSQQALHGPNFILDFNILDFDITNEIVPFLGPNYNFYKDIDVKLNIKEIINIIISNLGLSNNRNLDLNNDISLKFYDNFNNEYKITYDYLMWSPNLQL